MTADDVINEPTKLCFVTIGATAAFDALIKAVFQRNFIRALADKGYTDLRVQYGKDGTQMYLKLVDDSNFDLQSQVGLTISGFDFNEKGLGAEVIAARDGVMISHAGSGSVLAALRVAVPLIVVPNSTLLNDHQVELAKEMDAQGYAVHGHLEDLPAALEAAEKLRKKMQEWPPKNAGGDGRGLVGAMDDMLGFVD